MTGSKQNKSKQVLDFESILNDRSLKESDKA